MTDKTVLDKLAIREKALNRASSRQRKEREHMVEYVDKDMGEVLPKEAVMRLRKKEELARLKVARTLLKQKVF